MFLRCSADGKTEVCLECRLLLPPVSATVSQNHHQPHEDVKRVHVNPHAPVKCLKKKKKERLNVQYIRKQIHRHTGEFSSLNNLRVNGVIFLYSIKRVCLCSLNDLLCIIEQEHAEQDQASINSY